MRQDKQLDLMRRLMRHMEAGSTARSETTFRNEMSSYNDPARHQQERQRLFRDRPVVMALSARLREPGDYFADTIDGAPLVLVRGKDGIARCFLNICRHRGARLVEGAGCGMKMFTCPYHAWTYGLDGRLKGIPDAESFADIDRKTSGLVEIPVHEAHGVIHVGPINRDIPPPTSPLGPLAEEIDEWGFERYHFFDSVRIRRRMNWKFVMDTFMETYHIQALHKATIDPIIYSNLMTFDGYGDHFRVVFARKKFDELKDRADDETVDVIPYIGFVYNLFAGATLIVQGTAHVELWRVTPVGEDPAWADIEMSMAVPEKPVTDKAMAFWRKNFDLAMATVDAEDFPLGQLIQENVDSGLQPHIHYGRNEPALGHFHGTIRRHLGLPETV